MAKTMQKRSLGERDVPGRDILTLACRSIKILSSPMGFSVHNLSSSRSGVRYMWPNASKISIQTPCEA